MRLSEQTTCPIRSLFQVARFALTKLSMSSSTKEVNLQRSADPHAEGRTGFKKVKGFDSVEMQ